jgi:hypothetical protein
MAEHLTVTPSGIGILFEDGEKDPETGKGKRRCYTVGRIELAVAASSVKEERENWKDQVRTRGEKLPSVTTVLGCLDKPGLMYAAEKLAVAGAIELAAGGELPLYVDAALSRMKSRERRFFQVWGKKADRGTLAHEDLVSVVAGGEIRELSSYSNDEQGFIRGVSAFAADWRLDVVDQELMVASVEHGYAGRLDLRARTHRIPGLGLWDLKTTESLPRYKGGEVKPPYPEHMAQLAGYELAARESGYGETDYQAVVRVDASGAYDMTVSWADQGCFLAFLGAYRALRGLSSRPKAEAA